MKVVHSRNRAPTARDRKVAKILREVSSESLRIIVERLAFPRHYTREKRANRKARDLLLKHARTLGYAPSLQGRFDNIVMATHPHVGIPQFALPPGIGHAGYAGLRFHEGCFEACTGARGVISRGAHAGIVTARGGSIGERVEKRKPNRRGRRYPSPGNRSPNSAAHARASGYPASACRMTPLAGSFQSTRSMRRAASRVPSHTITMPACWE
jgi:hypothetical protein